MDTDSGHGTDQGCNFWNLIGSAQWEMMFKYLKILMDMDFTSDLPHFLANIRCAQLYIGGAEAPPKRFKVTPMI